MQVRGGKTAGILVSDTDAWFVRRALAGLAPELASLGWAWKAFELKGRRDLDYHRFIEAISDEEGLNGLIYGHLKLSLPQLARFRQRGFKVVGLTERFDGIDWITVDEVQGAYLATKHLLELGHRRLALVNGPPSAIQCALREDGFRRALRDFGLRPGREMDMRILSMADDEGRDAANLLMDLAQPPSAIFVAAGDVAALGVMEGLRDRGLRVPQDVSVVGFDDLELARLTQPTLTTVHQPLEAMGRWAARRLVAAVEAGPLHQPQGEILAAELVQRASCAPLLGDARQAVA